MTHFARDFEVEAGSGPCSRLQGKALILGGVEIQDGGSVGGHSFILVGPLFCREMHGDSKTRDRKSNVPLRHFVSLPRFVISNF